MKISILGAGIAGLSAAYHLKSANINFDLYEQNPSWGGLCDNFTINGFRFDRFVHFSHTQNEYVKELFSKSTKSHHHPPECSNYYKGHWLKHPAQNNLKPLPLMEKLKIIKGFLGRKKIASPENYHDWLMSQYGDYFTSNFPGEYTKKYWSTDAHDLRTEWVGIRMATPGIGAVIKGAFLKNNRNNYYTNEMRYPLQGGYKTYLNVLAKDLEIKTDHKVMQIDTKDKTIKFANGLNTNFDKIVSSLPLPEICNIILGCPQEVMNASQNLNCTAGVLVSIGLKKPQLNTDLWFYIYDKDIIAARVYSPSLKSPDNAPTDHCSLQAEIYFNNKEVVVKDRLKALEENTIGSLVKMGVFSREEIVIVDTRYQKYANVIFDKDIYKNRKVIHNYLLQNDIVPIGRFGEWDYLWSDQSLESGRVAANEVISRMKV